jgi:deoxyribose-phosphate aldolase
MTGLRQKILSATSEAEVSKLMEEGKTYEFASVKTRNSWKSAAARRLRGDVYAPKVVDAPAKKKKVRRSR